MNTNVDLRSLNQIVEFYKDLQRTNQTDSFAFEPSYWESIFNYIREGWDSHPMHNF